MFLSLPKHLPLIDTYLALHPKAFNYIVNTVKITTICLGGGSDGTQWDLKCTIISVS